MIAHEEEDKMQSALDKIEQGLDPSDENYSEDQLETV